MDMEGSSVPQGGGATGEGGGLCLLAAFFFTMVCGAFLAYYSSVYVSGDLRVRRFDMFSENDNPAISSGVPQLPARERVEVKGRTLTLLWLDGNRHHIPFKSEDRAAIAVRVSAYLPEVRYNRPELTVSVNGHGLETLRPRWRGGMEKFDFEIPAAALGKGVNLVTFAQTGGASYRIGYESVNARDYAGVSKRFPRAYVLFDDNLPAESLDPYARPYDYIIYPASVFLIWTFGANLIRAGRGIAALRASRTVLYAYLPVCILLTGSAVFSALSRYTVVLDWLAFNVFAMAPGLLCVSYGLTLCLRGMARRGAERDRAARERAALLRLGPLWRAFRFISRNAGSIAIAVFAVFLSGAGVSLILKRQDIADRLADIAFFSILFAVVVRAFELRGDREGKEEG